MDARLRLKRLLEQFIFVVLLLLIALTAIPYGTVEPQWREFWATGIFGLGALWLIHGWLVGEWHRHGGHLILPLLGLALLAFSQTLPIGAGESFAGGLAVRRALSMDVNETRLFALHVLALALTLEMLFRYTNSRRRIRALIYVVIGIALSSTLFGLLRQQWQGEQPGFLLPNLAAGSGYGQFINKNHFAFLGEMGLGLVLGLAVGGGVRRKYLPIYGIFALLLGLGIVMTVSRAGTLSILSMVGLVGLFASRRVLRTRRMSRRAGRHRRWSSRVMAYMLRGALVVWLVGIVWAGVSWVGGDELMHRMDTLADETHTSTQHINRMQIWQATWGLIKTNPLAGVGFGSYATAITQYHESSGSDVLQHADNDFLELMAEGGLCGAALLLWFGLALLMYVRASLRTPDEFRRAICYGALTGIFAAALHSLFDFGLHVTVNTVVFLSLIVLATVGAQSRRDVADAYGRHTARPAVV